MKASLDVVGMPVAGPGGNARVVHERNHPSA